MEKWVGVLNIDDIFDSLKWLKSSAMANIPSTFIFDRHCETQVRFAIKARRSRGERTESGTSGDLPIRNPASILSGKE